MNESPLDVFSLSGFPSSENLNGNQSIQEEHMETTWERNPKHVFAYFSRFGDERGHATNELRGREEKAGSFAGLAPITALLEYKQTGSRLRTKVIENAFFFNPAEQQPPQRAPCCKVKKPQQSDSCTW